MLAIFQWLAFTTTGRAVGIAVLLLAALWWWKGEVADEAVRDLLADQRREEIDRAKRAAEADEASRRCSRDPACGLSDDGWRRD